MESHLFQMDQLISLDFYWNPLIYWISIDSDGARRQRRSRYYMNATCTKHPHTQKLSQRFRVDVHQALQDLVSDDKLHLTLQGWVHSYQCKARPWMSRGGDRIPGYPRISLDILGYSRISYDILGYPRISWDILRYPRIFWDILGYPRISQHFIGFPLIS